VTDYFQDFARLGSGWVLYLLVLLSVISIGVMIERAIWFSGRDADADAFIREMRAAAARGTLDAFCERYRDASAVSFQIARAGLAERDLGVDAVAEAMHGARSKWRRAGDAHLLILGTLGNTVPFVGLFGTVLGVIKAFDKMQGNHTDAMGLVVSELASALTATAVGLMVAIPAVVAFNAFSRKLRNIMAGSDECAHAVLGLIYGNRHATATVPDGDPTTAPVPPASPAAPREP
jgi:biopolymer transport protein ExbB